MTPRERRAMAGSEMAMIFQEPVASLNPCFTVGFQIEETLEKHTDLDKAARRGPRRRAPAGGRHPRARGAAEVLPAPDVRRPVPAGDDRHRHRLQPAAPDRRRADHGARRDDPEADPRAPAAAAGRARHGAGAHHPRHGRGGRDRRPGDRAVQRPQDGGHRRRCRSSSGRRTPTPGRCSRRCRRTPPAGGCRRSSDYAPGRCRHERGAGARDPRHRPGLCLGRHVRRQAGGARAEGHRPQGRPRQDPGGGGRVGLRQVDAGADHHHDRPADRRQAADRGQGGRHRQGRGVARDAPQGADRVPEPLWLAEPAAEDRRRAGRAAGAQHRPAPPATGATGRWRCS